MPARPVRSAGIPTAAVLLMVAGACQPMADLIPGSTAGDAPAVGPVATAEGAWTACQRFAGQRLYDVQSTRWPSFSSGDVYVQHDDRNPNRYGVISLVHSPNARGTVVPQTVVCLMDWEPEREEWALVTVTSKYGGLFEQDAGFTLTVP